MKKNKMNITKKDLKVLLSIIVLVFLIFLILYVRNFRNFAEVKLGTNKKKIFTISDLKINDLKYSSTEEEVIKSLGKANKTEELSANGFEYKILRYKDLNITLREHYDDYVLVGVETTSNNYKMSRNLKVGSNINKVFNKYRIDYKSGNYLYGNYKYEEMVDKSINNNIYMGIRTKSKVSYYNMDPRPDDDMFPLNSLAKIEFEYKNGTVTKITWSYDYE